MAPVAILTLFLSGPACAARGVHNGAGPSSAAASTAPSERITVEAVSVNGSGCPAGTARVFPASDNTDFAVAYDNYRAQAGDGSALTDSRKNCQIAVLVHVPQGFTYAVAQADYYGLVHLESGATALQRTNYYFQGSAHDNYSDHEFSGPSDGDWHTTDTADVATLVYAPCGVSRILNVNTELRVNAGTSHPGQVSYLSMDWAEGNVNTVYHLSWKRC